MQSILFITGNDTLAAAVQKGFAEYRYLTSVAKSEAAGLAQLQRHQWALLLIDRRSFRPEALTRLLEARTLPVVAVQEPGIECAEEDCAKDLERGLDACICNQSYRQVIARVRAILRTNQRQMAAPVVYQAGSVVMDVGRHEVRVDGKLVDLTPREFQILKQFLSSPRVVLSRQQLLNRVWGEDYALEEHALDVHIHALRHKIECDPHRPTHIITVRGVGYKLVAD